MQERADFRNGKYEGEMNAQGQRHGLGIFIDDDLTFYISNWRQNRINGLSLIYISHGKYIYGEWKDSEPHGLTVFRSGDTVLVGNCTRGRPIGRCLVIFERFNFACVLQQAGEEWAVVGSGQLTTYDTLLQYIDLLGTPVPDHFFSLTKFACHFSKHSAHVKTLPCLAGCCYFGYSNGLALVFNATNGLVSVGLHKEEQVSEFGGKFEGTRWAEEGCFERGGERVRYSGERPSNKIYSIFQKIHKRSLDFHNEYFDSKVKFFTFIEEMLRSQLHLIAKECRRDKQLRHVDLSESLDYQDYTEEQSLKINSIRDIIYEAPATGKELQDKSKSPRYFKKPEKINKQLNEIQLSKIQKQKEEPKTPKPTIKSKLSTSQANNLSQLKKTPIKETSEFVPESHKKAIPSDIQIQRTDNFMRDSIETPSTPSKLRDRMKSNNLRYINAQIEIQPEEKKEKTPIAIKTNNIYREIKAKKEENIGLVQESLASSQETENYRVPNFQCLNNTSDLKKDAQRASSPPAKKNPPKEAFMPQTSQKYDNTKPERAQASPQLHRKSINVSNLSKPNYEDIDERRKRILQEYRNLNHPSASKQAEGPKMNLIQKKLDSPCNLIFSLSKEEQSSFGCMPITISDKANIKRDKPQPVFNRPFRPEGLHERQNNAERTPPGRANLKPEKPLKYSNYPEYIVVDQQENMGKNAISTSSKNGTTPTRVKKNYQYIYE